MTALFVALFSCGALPLLSGQDLSAPGLDEPLTPLTFEYRCDGLWIRLAMDPEHAYLRLDAAATDGTRGGAFALLEDLAPRTRFISPTVEDLLGYPGLARLRFIPDLSSGERLDAIRALDARPEIEWATGSFAETTRVPDGSLMLPLPQVLVSLERDTAHETLRTILDSTRLPGSASSFTIDRRVHGARPTFVLDHDGTPFDSFALAEFLRTLPGVHAAQPEFVRRLNAHGTPNDTLFSTQWDLENTGQHGGTPGSDMRAIEAWDITTGSADIAVAIIDEGVDTLHPDLVAQLTPGYDAVTISTGGGPTPNGALPGHADPSDAHGTACAGIVGARGNNGLGTSGICWEVTLVPIRIGFGEFWTQDSWIVDGIGAAVALGADVLSNSWGGGAPTPMVTVAINDAVTLGRNGLGAPVFFSSGNSDLDQVAYPANLFSTIAVGASSPCDERKSPTSCDGQWWWGSQYGPTLDLVAPGPLVTTTDNIGAGGYVGGNYVEFSGTSSACPHAAGAAALLLSVDPTLSSNQVRDLLISTAEDQIGSYTTNAQGFNEEIGFGRLDLMELLLAAGGATVPPRNLVCAPNSLDAVLTWTNGGTYTSIEVTRNEQVIATLPGNETTFTDPALGLGLYRYRVSGIGPDGPSPRVSCSALIIGVPTDLVWSPRAGAVPGGAPIAAALLSLGRLPLVVSDLTDAGSLEQYSSIWVNLGVFDSTNPDASKHILTPTEGLALDAWLTAGTPASPRYLYMEGGDTWFFDMPTAVHARFGILAIDDGSAQAQLDTILGLAGAPGCDFSGLQFGYVGEDNFLDWLTPTGGGSLVLENQSPQFGVAVANAAPGYRTIGASWELAGISEGIDTVQDCVEAILTCWGIPFLQTPLPDPITNLNCSIASATTQLDWGLGDLYDSIEVRRNGSLIAVLPGDATTAIDPVPNSGDNIYEVIGQQAGLDTLSVACAVSHGLPANVIRIPDLKVQFDEPVEIPVLADHPLPLEGFGFAVAYDNSVVSISGVSLVGTVLETSGSDFFAEDIRDAEGLVTVTALLDTTPPVTNTIPPGLDNVIVRLVGSVPNSATIGSQTVLEIPESVGSPPVVTAFLENGMTTYPPQREHGSLTVTDIPDLLLHGSVEIATPGGLTTTTVLLDCDRPLTGYSFGLAFGPDQLTPTTASFVGTVGENAAFSLTDLDPFGGSVTASVIIDLIPPYDEVIAIGLDQPVLRIDWFVDPAVAEGTILSLPILGGIGDPPVPLVVTDDLANPLTPTTLPATIEVGGFAAVELFIRGDVGMDGSLSMADPIALLGVLFQSHPLACADAADTNDDGFVDVADVVFLLQHLFAGSAPPPPPPFPTPGPDPTADSLDCSP